LDGSNEEVCATGKNEVSVVEKDTLLFEGTIDSNVKEGLSISKKVNIPKEVIENVEDTELLESELPPGWVKLSDPSGRFYYYNEAEDKLTWEEPSMPMLEVATKQVEKSNKLRVEVIEAEETIPTKNEENLNESELPPGWIEVVDPVLKIQNYPLGTKRKMLMN